MSNEEDCQDLPPLVDAAWLAARLNSPGLRVLECTVWLHPAQSGVGQTAVSGRPDWEKGHIPGSGFADLIEELSDTTLPYRFMLPPPNKFAAGMGRLGIGDDSRLVLYDRDQGLWAARLWWMLRAFGFERASVLNGGWGAWVDSGLPVSIEPCRYPLGKFSPSPRDRFFIDKASVQAAVVDNRAIVINALRHEQYVGASGVNYGRAGRIPGSVNVPYRSLHDSKANRLRSLEEMRAKFAQAGVFDASRAVIYCGSGIAASGNAFVLHLLGFHNVSVYDASLEEWASNPNLPMVTGQEVRENC